MLNFFWVSTNLMDPKMWCIIKFRSIKVSQWVHVFWGKTDYNWLTWIVNFLTSYLIFSPILAFLSCSSADFLPTFSLFSRLERDLARPQASPPSSEEEEEENILTWGSSTTGWYAVVYPNKRTTQAHNSDIQLFWTRAQTFLLPISIYVMAASVSSWLYPVQ